MTHTYTYNVHDILRIRSQRRLPELGYFRVETLDAEPDIDVRITSDPYRQRREDSIEYREIAGRFGFCIVINRSEAVTEVFASPLVGRSPHVLYTNVVEPLLRWALVRKGYALMHGATLSFGGKALFITAQTDTGKTTTILKTLRTQPEGCAFLSDDMTIFARDGAVFNYPKPLTISQHTLQAMGGSPLTVPEKLFLQVQSRLHSRGGRKVGMWLNDNNTPAATLNAIVQWMIPPPKFMVDRLVPGTSYADRAQLTSIALIERGNDERGSLERDQMIDILLANADDAYGFPPYPVLADRLSAWQGQDLHPAERAIVADAIEGVPGVRLSSSSYDWYRHLPRLVDPSASTAPAPQRSGEQLDGAIGHGRLHPENT